MKRILTIVLLAALCLGCMSISAWAAEEDYTADTWANAELKGLIYQDGEYINSDVAENYEAWWWEGEIPEMDDYFMASYINMRGFSMSADGRYAYMGALNGGSGVRGLVVLDMQVGRVTDLYYSYNEVNPLPGSPFSYAKGIAADDRGYVYVGFAYSVNYNYLSLGIAKQEDNGKLTEVIEIPVYTNELEPGDEAGTKIGVNGVEVAKVGDKYLCFVMANYDVDVLYCYDVTDPAAPVLNASWALGGMIDFAAEDCTIDMGGKTLKEGQYLAVDNDGTVWLCVDFNEGGNGIIKIDPTGINCVKTFDLTGVYSVAHVGKFLLAGMKDGTAVQVLNDSTGEQVATIDVPDANRVTRIQVINDTLYVCGAGADSMTYNYIYAAPLTDAAKAAYDEQVAALDKYQQENDTWGEETEAPTETETEAETEAQTEAKTEATTEAKTEAKTEAPAVEQTTEAPAEKSGCGSVIGSAAIVAAIALGALVIAKKKD